MTDFISVRVGKLPGKISEVALNGERTVSAALEAAEITSTDGFEIRVGGQVASSSTPLAQGDTVLLVKKIKGN